MAALKSDISIKGKSVEGAGMTREPVMKESFGDVFARKIGDTLTKGMSKIGIGGGSGGAAAAAGIAAGITGSGIMAVVDIIVGFLKDMPMISSIFKLLKLLLMVLFMPLIPILKPILIILSEGIKMLVPAMQNITKIIANVMSVTIMPIVDLIVTFMRIIGEGSKLLGKCLDELMKPMKEAGAWLHSQFQKLWSWIKDAGKWIWDKILKPAFEFLNRVGEWIWDIVKTGFSNLLSFGLWIWDTFIAPPFQAFFDAVEKIYKTYIEPAFSPIWKGITTIWGNLKTSFYSFINGIIKLWNKIVDMAKKIGINLKKAKEIDVNDAIITPSGVVHTNPNDYIIATKNPAGLGGGQTININIDKPMLNDAQSIRVLVKQISQELYKEQRRYNSYV